MEMNLTTHRPLTLLVPLTLALACSTAVPGMEGDGDNTDTSDPSAQTDGEPAPGDPGVYTVRGGVIAAEAAEVVWDLANLRVPLGGEMCPFEHNVGQNPCDDPACRDDNMSQACQDAVEQYCSQNPGDPGCMGGPGDGPGGGSSGGGSSGGGSSGGPWDKEVLGYATPTSLWLKVYQVQLSTDAQGCTNAVPVGQSDAPEYQNFADSPVLVTGDPPADGTYQCVIITMSDHIRWQVEGEPACEAENAQDVYGEHDGGEWGVEEQITIYLSTAGSTDPDDDGAFQAPGMLLEAPLQAGPEISESMFYMKADDAVEIYETWEGVSCEMMPPVFGFANVSGP